jgi:hypothetical protein
MRLGARVAFPSEPTACTRTRLRREPVPPEAGLMPSRSVQAHPQSTAPPLSQMPRALSQGAHRVCQTMVRLPPVQGSAFADNPCSNARLRNGISLVLDGGSPPSRGAPLNRQYARPPRGSVEASKGRRARHWSLDTVAGAPTACLKWQEGGAEPTKTGTEGDWAPYRL